MRLCYGVKWFRRLLLVSLALTWFMLHFLSSTPQNKPTETPAIKIPLLNENLYTYVGKRNSSFEGTKTIPLDKFLKLASLFRVLTNVNGILSPVQDLFNDLWHKDHSKVSYFDGENKSKALLDVKPRQILILGSAHSSVDALFRSLHDYLPEAFVHSEPLRSLSRLNPVTKPQNTEKALRIIQQLFRCAHLPPEHYEYMNKYGQMASWNYYYWRLCEGNEQLCKFPTTFHTICAISPVQFMSTTQLPVAWAEKLLRNSALSHLKIVYVSKDPRRVLQSKRNKPWCLVYRNCFNATQICERMQQDLDHAEILREKYPDRFRYVSDEDVTVHPVNVLRQLLPFTNLPYYPRTLKKMESKHQQPMHEVLSNTVLTNSLNTWQSVLTSSEVCNTETVCKKVLKRLNLTIITKDTSKCAPVY